MYVYFEYGKINHCCSLTDPGEGYLTFETIK